MTCNYAALIQCGMQIYIMYFLLLTTTTKSVLISFCTATTGVCTDGIDISTNVILSAGVTHADLRCFKMNQDNPELFNNSVNVNIFATQPFQRKDRL